MKKTVFLFCFTLIALIIVTGCGNKTDNSESSNLSTEDNGQKTDNKLILGYATCAPCLAMKLTPNYTENVNLEATRFASGNDVLTALISKSVDVAQVTYLHYITALDKGFDIVALSGEINGGSELIVSNKLNVEEDDWDVLKKIIEEKKASGNKLKIAASRGNAQDIHMRGAFLKHGIDPNKDVQFINISNPADHASAIENGEVDMLSTVEPFASQIRLKNIGKHFAYPYDQSAGNLTNLIVTRSDVIKEKPEQLQEVVNGVVKMVDDLNKDNTPWLDVLSEETSLDPNIGKEALKNSYPDYKMHLNETLAISKMMKDLNYINSDVSDKAEKYMDYSFLEKATGKDAKELGK